MLGHRTTERVTVLAPFGPIVKPVISDELDDEIELGVVIGRECRHVAVEDARSVIAGYLVTNDVSVRDRLAKRSPTFTLGKSFDTHAPMGPWLTTDDEIDDPLALRMRLTVNDELRQDWRTDDMIYDVYEQITYLTQVMTLKPGDILATGTPSGIGAPRGASSRPATSSGPRSTGSARSRTGSSPRAEPTPCRHREVAARLSGGSLSRPRPAGQGRRGGPAPAPGTRSRRPARDWPAPASAPSAGP